MKAEKETYNIRVNRKFNSISFLQHLNKKNYIKFDIFQKDGIHYYTFHKHITTIIVIIEKQLF